MTERIGEEPTKDPYRPSPSGRLGDADFGRWFRDTEEAKSRIPRETTKKELFEILSTAEDKRFEALVAGHPGEQTIRQTEQVTYELVDGQPYRRLSRFWIATTTFRRSSFLPSRQLSFRSVHESSSLRYAEPVGWHELPPDTSIDPLCPRA